MHDHSQVDNQSAKDKFHRFDEFTCTFRDIKQEIVQGKVWNVPNLIMFLRLALGVYSIRHLKITATPNPFLVILFVLMMFLLDMLDGILARKHHQETHFGKIFDPLVDKFLIMYGIITVFNLLQVPTSLSIPFYSTHIIMVLGSLFLILTNRTLPAVRSYGAVSNVLAVASAAFYWLGSTKWGRRIMVLAIASGIGLLIDYAKRIDWKRRSIKKEISTSADYDK